MPSPYLFIEPISAAAAKHSNPGKRKTSSASSSATLLPPTDSTDDVTLIDVSMQSSQTPDPREISASRASSASSLSTRVAAPSGFYTIGLPEPSQSIVAWVNKAGEYAHGLSQVPQSPMFIRELPRTIDEQDSGKERLNLSRQNLQSCISLENESLRLINYQKNLISKIEHVENLRNLVFLDFYDNRIERISGLHYLHNLRVLMLGCNRIRQIEGLGALEKLDVLDLHSNKIEVIENLSHLADLRVLNLEDNSIKQASQLGGLISIVEINLKRNQISSVRDVKHLAHLKKLLLGQNDITSFDAIAEVFKMPHLQEFTIDGNPVCKDGFHRAFVINRIRTLKVLDGKRITEEERRAAIKLARREIEKRKESERVLLEKEQRERALANIRHKWQLELASGQVSEERDVPQDVPLPRPWSSHTRPSSSRLGSSRASSASNARSKGVLGEYVRIFCGDAAYLELQNGVLNIYGDGIGLIDRIEPTVVSSVRFVYINIARIGSMLFKLRRFTNLQTVILSHNDMTNLKQINHLAPLCNVTEIDILPDNPVIAVPLFHHYTLFRLNHLPLKKLSGKAVTNEDLGEAERKFGALRRTINRLPPSMLARTPDVCIPIGTNPNDSANDGRSYHPARGLHPRRATHYKSLAETYVQKTITESIRQNIKIQQFNDLWPDLVQEAILHGFHTKQP